MASNFASDKHKTMDNYKNQNYLTQKAEPKQHEQRKTIGRALDNFRETKYRPQKSWLFTVDFFLDETRAKTLNLNGTSYFGSGNLVSLQVVSCSLPSEDVHIAERQFLGRKYSLPTYADRSGECTIEFYYRTYPVINASVFDILAGTVNNRNNESSVFDTSTSTHNELYQLFDKIVISMLDDTMKTVRTYTLCNPIVTGFEHSTELNYESEDIMKWTMTVHYDWWYSSLK